MDEELLDMIGFHDSELKSGAYVPKSRQREMAYEENKKREITESYRGLCARAIETERKQLEIERANLKYNEFIKRFDLQKIYGLPDDDRRKIFEAARVPVDGPHSKSDRMNLLQFYKKYPYQYR